MVSSILWLNFVIAFLISGERPFQVPGVFKPRNIFKSFVFTKFLEVPVSFLDPFATS
jgi:hypothetical protein